MADSGSRKRLGRGLAALIGEMDDMPADGKHAARPESQRADRRVPIEQIRANPNNPRRQFSEEHLADLARSIAEHGIVQPILVRPIKGADLGGARYEIIAGERRWRAAQKASLHEIPVILREVEDKEALELAIIENVQRADLNPVEEAQGYQQLIDEYDYTQADLGNVIGKSRSHVANTLRLLKLPDAVRSMLSSGELSAGHARAVVTSSDPVGLANRIIKDGLSVRQAEALAQEQAGSEKPPRNLETKSLDLKAPDIKALERQIEDQLGLAADIRLGKGEKGELRIKYKTLEQFESLCQRLLT
ncbi:ParB/RepB/Spo0J family partition protein [Salaquimonas pukyongi]|uniref:ParB/RepB/Spo0J family partition protein n=1 Tax=Salaquimonas pukyongi TaxID=2712698 RepID=UPI00096B876F|nr:ParB/RepB/Spo0J family partition protein [Salaquimonas pukyongi]